MKNFELDFNEKGFCWMGCRIGNTIEEINTLAKNGDEKNQIAKMILDKHHNVFENVAKVAQIYKIWSSFKNDFEKSISFEETIDGVKWRVSFETDEDAPIVLNQFKNLPKESPSIDAPLSEWQKFVDELQYNFYKKEAFEQVNYSTSINDTYTRHLLLSDNRHFFVEEGKFGNQLKCVVKDETECWKSFVGCKVGKTFEENGLIFEESEFIKVSGWNTKMQFGNLVKNKKGTKIFEITSKKQATAVAISFSFGRNFSKISNGSFTTRLKVLDKKHIVESNVVTIILEL